MKSLLIAVALFSVLLLAIILNSVYISAFCQEFSDIAASLPSSDNRQELIELMKAKWKNNRMMLDISIRTGEIERMNDLIEGLYASHSAQNEFEFLKYCTLIQDLSEELAEYEKISLRSLC